MDRHITSSLATNRRGSFACKNIFSCSSGTHHSINERSVALAVFSQLIICLRDDLWWSALTFLDASGIYRNIIRSAFKCIQIDMEQNLIFAISCLFKTVRRSWKGRSNKAKNSFLFLININSAQPKKEADNHTDIPLTKRYRLDFAIICYVVDEMPELWWNCKGENK